MVLGPTHNGHGPIGDRRTVNLDGFLGWQAVEEGMGVLLPLQTLRCCGSTGDEPIPQRPLILGRQFTASASRASENRRCQARTNRICGWRVDVRSAGRRGSGVCVGGSGGLASAGS